MKMKALNIMKNRITPFAIFLILTLVVTGCTSASYSSINFPQFNLPEGNLAGVVIDINTQNNGKSLPKVANVYKVRNPEVTNSTVTELAKIFGLFGDVRIEQQGGAEQAKMYSLQRGKELLDVYAATGGFFYMDLDDLWNGGPINEIPTNEEAVAIATEYLKSKGLLFEDLYPDGVTHSYESDLQENKHVTDVVVGFGRKVDSIPIDGVGTPAKVYLGEGGQITGVTMLWRKLSPLGKVPLIDHIAAIEEVKANIRNNSFRVPPKSKELNINNVELVYFDEGIAFGQTQLKPAYKYTGNIRADDNSVLPFVGYIEAQQ